MALSSLYSAADASLTPVAAAIEQRAAQEEQKRIQRIARAWRYYQGDHDRQLKTEPAGYDHNVIFNLSRVVVDKSVAYLFGGNVEFIGETDAATETQEEYLEAVWTQNRKAQTLHRLGVNGAVCGQAFIKLAIEDRLEYPRLILLDPANMTVLYDPDDYERVLQYRYQWTGIDPATGKAVVRRQLITRAAEARWDIVDQIVRGNGKWETLNEQVWMFEWAPVFACQNLPLPNVYWGMADLEEDLLHLNDKINFLLSDLAKILFYHGHPVTWGRGFDAARINRSIENIIALPSETGELHNLEMLSDLSSGQELLRRLREAFHELARVPEVATGRTEDLGALSGVALQILYGPLDEKTATKQLLYGDMLNDLNRRLLELGGLADAPLQCQWPDNRPKDSKTEAETANLKQQIGVSKATLLAEMGYDADAEQERRQGEQEEEQANLAAVGDRMMTQFDRGQVAE